MTEANKCELAILSVFDKKNLVKFATVLSKIGLTLVASGGTARLLRENNVHVKDVSTITGHSEMLGGRVKTLHPAIHAGILARNIDSDMIDMQTNNLDYVRVVVCNLYPFRETTSNPDCTPAEALDNIDIGGVTLLRAAAKNFPRVTAVCDPEDYNEVGKEMELNGGQSSLQLRTQLALKAFEHTAGYDEAICSYLRREVASPGERTIPLRYGTNPHQKEAEFFSVQSRMPLKVLNGSPGYINVLDALNGWQLVDELSKATGGLPCATSFKHLSPAGAAVGLPLNGEELASCMLTDLAWPSVPSIAAAYARARGADRLSSFGDFIAISGKCDELTARIIVREVSDGIVAPDFEPMALSLLAKKKKGNYIIFKVDPVYMPSETEERTVFGLKLRQKRNLASINKQLFQTVVSQRKDLPESALLDLLVATVALKYTQSNSVCYAYKGQVIGIGAGQQSRIHCTRLAGEKAANWWFRQHPKVLSLPFKSCLKRSEKANLIDTIIAGEENADFDWTQWSRRNFDKDLVVPLTQTDKKEWIDKMDNVVLSSDAFFPFRDNIDHAAKYGVKYVASPGGSTRDDDIIAACDNLGMTLVHTGVRLFHH